MCAPGGVGMCEQTSKTSIFSNLPCSQLLTPAFALTTVSSSPLCCLPISLLLQKRIKTLRGSGGCFPQLPAPLTHSQNMHFSYWPPLDSLTRALTNHSHEGRLPTVRTLPLPLTPYKLTRGRKRQTHGKLPCFVFICKNVQQVL